MYNDTTITKIRALVDKIEKTLEEIDLDRINKAFKIGIENCVYKRQVIGLINSIEKSVYSDYRENTYYSVSPSYGIGEAKVYRDKDKPDAISRSYWINYRFDELDVLDYAKYLIDKDISNFVSKNKLDIYKIWKKALKYIGKYNCTEEKKITMPIYSVEKSPKSQDDITPTSFIDPVKLNIEILRSASYYYSSGSRYTLKFKFYISWGNLSLRQIDHIMEIWSSREKIYNTLNNEILPHVKLL